MGILNSSYHAEIIVSSEGFQCVYGLLTLKDFSVFISIGNIILFCLLMCKAPGSAKLLEAAGPEVMSSSWKCKALVKHHKTEWSSARR
jgi:hypothetical protein